MTLTGIAFPNAIKRRRGKVKKFNSVSIKHDRSPVQLDLRQCSLFCHLRQWRCGEGVFVRPPGSAKPKRSNKWKDECKMLFIFKKMFVWESGEKWTIF